MQLLFPAKLFPWRRACRHDTHKKETAEMPHQICYSEKYFDDVYEYRHVILPKDVASNVPQGRLMSEAEWRKLGVQQSRGWVHYMVHKPEPHILLFRRPRQQQA